VKPQQVGAANPSGLINLTMGINEPKKEALPTGYKIPAVQLVQH
jgi:hypothetical protein